MSDKQPTVYIMASKRNGTLYTGVTSAPERRIQEHKLGLQEGFTKRYGIHTLVYIEEFEDMYSAIEREKHIKAGSRKKKIALIEEMNPTWRDLSNDL